MRKQLLILMNLGPLIMWLSIRLALHLINTHLTTSIIGHWRKLARLLLISMSLITILQMTWSYISPLKCYMLVFKTLMQLKLRILTSLVIKSLIVTIIGVGIRVYTHSLMKGLIGRMYNYSLYCGATYYRQQLCLPYNRPSVIFIIL